MIFRYVDVTPQGEERTVLAVEKIGREGAFGCPVAQIAGDTPQANARARPIADERAEIFDCTKEPLYIGNAR